MDKTLLKKLFFYITLTIIIMLGVFIRIKGYLINPSMWHDECALGWNSLHKNFADYFKILRFAQTAPPLFMIISKLSVMLVKNSKAIFDISLALRAFPLFCGILSIFAFLKISLVSLKNKLTVIIAVLLFALNIQLISYSYEFKPYMSDTLIFLVLLIFFANMNLQTLKLKKSIILSITMASTIWLSFTSVFIISAGLVNEIIKRANSKKLAIMFLPTIISWVLYANFYLINTYKANSNIMLNYWQSKFIASNFSNFTSLLLQNTEFIFFPSKLALIGLALVIFGAICFYREKQNNLTNLILLTLASVIVASVFKIYPFSERLILFLAPVFILLFIKPMDKINFNKKIKSLIIIILSSIIIIPQLLFSAELFTAKSISKGEYPREMMIILAQNIKPSDKIFTNRPSNVEYQFYSSFYKINNEVIVERIENKDPKNYLKLLNDLKNGNYWFYIPFEDTSTNSAQIIKKWATENTKLAIIKEAGKSILIYSEK